MLICAASQNSFNWKSLSHLPITHILEQNYKLDIILEIYEANFPTESSVLITDQAYLDRNNLF